MLLGGFQLSDGDAPATLSAAAQQLFAFLAIQGRPVRRRTVAGALWPESTEERSLGALRSALARLDPPIRALIVGNALDITLDEHVSCDLTEARAIAEGILRGVGIPEPAESAGTLFALSSDLLPDWYQEWTLAAARDWHRLRVRALSVLADHFVGLGRFEEAASAADAALAAEPLYEAAFATLVHIANAQGRHVDAAAVVARYGAALLRDLGVESPPSLDDLMNVPSSAIPDPALDPPVVLSSVLHKAHTAVAGEETEALEVVASGLSMEPTIRQGDTLLYSKNIAPNPGRIVVAIHDGAWIVKRVALRDGELVLRSDNADEEVNLDRVTVRGVVVELHRSI